MRRHLAALTLFTILTGLLAFPVLSNLTRGVPGWEGDNLFFVHSVWWWKHALVDLRTSPFFDPETFVPVGRENGRSELTATNTIPALPVTWLAGPVAAYNVMVLLSFVTTAFFTYLWVERMTGRRAAGVVAGTVAAFVPMRFAHMAGHLPELSTQWMALTLYSFDRYLDDRSLRRALALGGAIALTVLGCWYYGYSLAVILPIYAILRTRPARVWREPRWWLGLVTAGAAAVAITSPFLYHMVSLQNEGALTRTLGAMDFWSLNLYDLFIPNLAHPLWGPAASRWFPVQRELWVERGVALGYVAIGLAAVGWLRARRQRAAAGLLGTWIAASVIALGPTLHWGDRQVRVPLGDTIARLAGGALKGTGGDTATVRESFARDGVPVPLPALLMYKFVPLTSSMRVMARFAIWSALMTAALAGFGVAAVLAWAERRWGAVGRTAAPAALVALVAFESLAAIPILPLAPRPVDTWLASQPRSVVIVELPVEQAQRFMQDYWMTQNAKPNLFGWIGDSFPPAVQSERAAALEGFPAPAALEYLQRSPATYLLVTPSEIPNWSAMEPVLAAAPALAHAQTIGGVRVYRIVR